MKAPSVRRPPWGLWVLLTLLSVSLFAPDRGLYQDDVSNFAVAKESWKTHGLPGLVAPVGPPTRRLLGLPLVLAWLTPEPVFALQLLYGLSWLALGWAAWALARELFPDAPRAAWLAGTLTLCATGDYLTGSPVALGYQACVLLGLLALAGGVKFVRGGSWLWLAGGGLCAAASLFTADGAAIALALGPLLFFAVGGLGGRAAAASAAWAAALAPYVVLLVAAFRAPISYVRTAAVPLALTERFRRTLALTGNDLLPWTWPLGRVPFGDPPARAIPVWIWVAAAAAGLALILRALARLNGDRPASRPARERLLAAWCAAAAVASHAAFAGVQFWQFFYRTQVLSRVLVSIVLGLAVSRLLEGRRARRAAAFVLVVLYAGFGIAGGMERQDLYLATWRRHRIELSSLVEEVPRARPGTTLLLVVPHDASYQAMEVPYLAQRWSELLWEDPATRPGIFLWSPDAQTACFPDREGFRCRPPEERECFDAGTCPGTRLRWEGIALLTWRPVEGRFRLEDEIPSGLLGGLPPPAGLYRPRDRILAGPDPSAARYLHGDVLFARLLP